MTTDSSIAIDCYRICYCYRLLSDYFRFCFSLWTSVPGLSNTNNSVILTPGTDVHRLFCFYVVVIKIIDKRFLHSSQ